MQTKTKQTHNSNHGVNSQALSSYRYFVDLGKSVSLLFF
jgi:hypothetical protein